MIETKNHNQSETERVGETRCVNSLREAWNRFVDNSYTCEDLALILDSVKDDKSLPAFYEVLDKVWNNTPPETEEQKEAYRKEASQLRVILPQPLPVSWQE